MLRRLIMMHILNPPRLTALLMIVLGLGLIAQPQSREEELGDIRREAEQLARDFVAERPDGTDVDIDAILMEAERFSAEAKALNERVGDRLAAQGAGGPASFFDEDGAIDAGALAAAAGDVARGARRESGEAPLFVAFVSLSMPDTALTSIIRETKEAGGVVVVRGFYGGGYASFATRIRALFEEGDEVGISVDPRYFQALGVRQVPTYAVLTGEPVCDGFACGKLEADTVSGNISVEAALRLLAEQGAVAPAHARAALARLAAAP